MLLQQLLACEIAATGEPVEIHSAASYFFGYNS